MNTTRRRVDGHRLREQLAAAIDDVDALIADSIEAKQALAALRDELFPPRQREMAG